MSRTRWSVDQNLSAKTINETKKAAVTRTVQLSVGCSNCQMPGSNSRGWLRTMRALDENLAAFASLDRPVNRGCIWIERLAAGGCRNREGKDKAFWRAFVGRTVERQTARHSRAPALLMHNWPGRAAAGGAPRTG